MTETPVAVAVYALDASGSPRAPVRGILVEASGAETVILVPKPFARDAAALNVLRIEGADADAAAPSTRITQFEVRDAGLYQKIVLASGALGQHASA